MHEFSITMEIVDIITKESEKLGGKKVSRVRLKVGALTGFYPEAIKYYYDALKAASDLLGESELQAESVPARISCRDCGYTSDLYDYIVLCPSCNSLNTQVDGGRDVTIESIEVEE